MEIDDRSTATKKAYLMSLQMSSTKAATIEKPILAHVPEARLDGSHRAAGLSRLAVELIKYYVVEWGVGEWRGESIGLWWRVGRAEPVEPRSADPTTPARPAKPGCRARRRRCLVATGGRMAERCYAMRYLTGS